MPLASFQQICINILQVKAEQDGLTITYLHNIPALLSLIGVVSEKDINLRLQAERGMPKHIFAFDR